MALPTAKLPAPLPSRIWTLPSGCGTVVSDGTPGTARATSTLPSASKSPSTPAVGMKDSPLVTVLIRLKVPVPSFWNTVRLLPVMLLPLSSDLPKLHTTASSLPSPVTSASPTQAALLPPAAYWPILVKVPNAPPWKTVNMPASVPLVPNDVLPVLLVHTRSRTPSPVTSAAATNDTCWVVPTVSWVGLPNPPEPLPNSTLSFCPASGMGSPGAPSP